jgi:hypothetical protein
MFKLAEDGFFNRRSQDLSYANYLMKHKLGVAEAGIQLDLPASTIIKHDWSKLRPNTWSAHRDYFYGSDGIKGKNERDIYLTYKASRKQHFLDEPAHHGLNKNIDQELESLADWYSVNKSNASLKGLNFPSFRLWWLGHRAKFAHQLSAEAVEKVDGLIAANINILDYIKRSF